MSTSGLVTGDDLARKVWLDDTFETYLGLNFMSRYMGEDENAVIQVREDLVKQQGEKLVFPLLGGLTGAGVSGDSTLEGNEEKLNSYSQVVTLDQYRNAVRTTGKLALKRYPFQFMNKVRPQLTTWKANFDEDKIFAAMGSIDGTAYGAASAGQKNTWTANNVDRVLFGVGISNYSATHATALATIDGTTDKLTCAHISLLKRMAKLARPRIRPIRIPNGPASEVFVYFAHPYSTRDLKTDSAWINAQLYAQPRGMDNPLFTGMIGMWDGVIVVESDKCAILVDVGNGATVDVAQNFFCGAQAVLWAQGGVNGDRLGFVEESFDYENQVGVAIESMYGIEKARFATGAAGVSKDHGIITSYVSGQPD